MILNKSLRNKEYLNKRKKKIYFRFLLFFFLPIILILVTAFFSDYKKISIDTVNISTESVLDVDLIKEKTLNFISGRYFYLFSKKNIFIYPKTALSNYIKLQFPQIKTLDITLTDSHTLLIDLKSRKPFALWCDDLPEESKISKCYFLDELGFVFAEAPQFSGDAYFKYYGILPYGSPIGSYFLKTEGRFIALSNFVESVKKMEISPVYLRAESEDGFILNLFGGAKIIFDTSDLLSKTSERLSVFLKTEGILQKQNGILTVDYIDLRFGNKIFYKEKQ